jgi:hypothetical protein
MSDVAKITGTKMNGYGARRTSLDRLDSLAHSTDGGIIV